MLPKTYKYTPTHEWVREDFDHNFTVGVTEYAQAMLGLIKYIQLPTIESEYEQNEDCVMLESTKTAVDIFCPIAGEIIEINERLLENPKLINNDPYGEGWLFRIRPVIEDDVKLLLDANKYVEALAAAAH